MLFSGQTGADLAHVFCTPGAAPVIKAYSPDLIVHPLLRESVGGGDEERAASGRETTTTTTTAAATATAVAASSASYSSRLAALSVSDIEPWLPRFDALVVGPGLGSDPAVEEAALLLLRRARDLGIALLVDADGLKLVSRDPQSLRGYSRAVVTPNAVEFERMAGSLGLLAEEEKKGNNSLLRFDAAAFAGLSSSSSSSSSSSYAADAPLDSVAARALELDGPVVVRTGAGDCMAVAVRSSSPSSSGTKGGGGGGAGASSSSPSSPPATTVVYSACCSRAGSPRRAGGQGDLTSGSVATYLAWACSRRLLAESGGKGEEGQEEAKQETKKKSPRPPAALAAVFGGCSLVRGAAAAAFSKKKRAALASDVLDAIEGAEESTRRGFDV